MSVSILHTSGCLTSHPQNRFRKSVSQSVFLTAVLLLSLRVLYNEHSFHQFTTSLWVLTSGVVFLIYAILSLLIYSKSHMYQPHLQRY